MKRNQNTEISKKAKDILNQLKNQLNEEKDKTKMSNLENELSKLIEYLIPSEELYSLPIDNIENIIKDVDFQTFIDSFELLKTFLSKLTQKHEYCIDILKSIQCLNCPLTIDECISLLSLFSQYELINKLTTLYEENKKYVIPDFEYHLSQKENELEEIREYLEENDLFYVPKLKEKPTDYVDNIFQACIYGKFTSVQYLIENEHLDISSQKLEQYGFSPIHVASLVGNLSIVRYLIEKTTL